MSHFPIQDKIYLLLLLTAFFSTSESSINGFTSIINFGDSISDTGNFIYSSGDSHAAYLPYGETFFHRPTGRFSDGRLIIDFLAEEMGIPYLPPYLPMAYSVEASKGINFAVAGATAMAADFFSKRGIALPKTNNSLGIQLAWFQKVLPSICDGHSDCKERFRRTIFMVGEIGGNDLNHPLFQGWEVEQAESLVPLLVKEIQLAMEALINYGATTLIVPGNFPLGCNACYLTIFESPIKQDYDKTGCLIKLNNLAKFQNQQLKQMVDEMRHRHPESVILYADYYTSAKHVYDFRQFLGLGEGGLRACCGGGGPYNFNFSVSCGRATICNNPSSYISWDGIHLTEAAYKIIAQFLLERLREELPVVSKSEDLITWA